MAENKEHYINHMGQLIKEARIKNSISRELLAERVGISVRYMTAIENEGRKPSYKYLSLILQNLGLSADKIFYPEISADDGIYDQITKLLRLCNDNELNITRSLIYSLLDNRIKE